MRHRSLLTWLGHVGLAVVALLAVAVLATSWTWVLDWRWLP